MCSTSIAGSIDLWILQITRSETVGRGDFHRHRSRKEPPKATPEHKNATAAEASAPASGPKSTNKIRGVRNIGRKVPPPSPWCRVHCPFHPLHQTKAPSTATHCVTHSLTRPVNTCNSKPHYITPPLPRSSHTTLLQPLALFLSCPNFSPALCLGGSCAARLARRV
jgi:hypothetical protein